MCRQLLRGERVIDGAVRKRLNAIDHGRVGKISGHLSFRFAADAFKHSLPEDMSAETYGSYHILSSKISY
jgi:hypothetical protein